MQTMSMRRLFAFMAGIIATAGYPLFIRNDGQTLEQLQNKLLELQASASSLQNAADAENRALTEEEAREFNSLMAAFEMVEEDIARRERLDAMNARLAAVPPANQSRTKPQNTEDPAAAGGSNGRRVVVATAEQTRQFAQPRASDAGKHGFRSLADFMNAVVKGSVRNAQPDPRLLNAAPGSYSSEGVGADGGFAVPPDFRQAIIEKIGGVDSFLPFTDEQVSTSNSISFPTDETTPWQSTGGIQAFWDGEAEQKTPSKAALTEKTVRLNKIIALVPMTDELLEDAPAMASYVQRKAPEKIVYKVNDSIVNGTGMGMPLGILNSPGTVVAAKDSGQATATVTFSNIMKLWALVTPTARINARWFVNPDVEQQLMQMQFPGTGTAVPVYMPPGGLSASPYGTLLGKPIVPTEVMQPLGSQGDIVFGDMKNYLTVTKAGGIRTDVSIHLWFDYDITAFRFVLRIGGQPWWNSAIAGDKSGSTTRGFFATLAARP